MSIINYIEKFRKLNRELFTTPSHGQGGFIIPDSGKYLGNKVFECDYSETDGFDNLSNPTGIIRDLMSYAADVYDSKATFFLTNGSTSGIIAAMLSVLRKNDKVLIARNCHRSVYNGLVLTGAIPIWIMPQYNKEWAIFESVNFEYMEEILSKNKDIKAIIVTNPTYEGVMSDIYRISHICKKYNVILIVDEAHGALWNFHKALGTPALMQGADIVIQSLHKTAGALNPSALLHVGKESFIDTKIIQDSLNLLNTTSPSYPLLLNIESTIRYLDSEKGKFYIYDLVKNINRFIRSIKSIPNLQVYYGNNDITKILLKVTNLTGYELSNILFEKYGIEDEMANEQSLLLLTGVGTTKKKLKRLEKALFELCSDNIKIVKDTDNLYHYSPVEPRVRYTPSLVWNAAYKEIEIKYALSKIAMEVILDYPPGVPILLPGEIIKKEHIEYLQFKNKLKIKVLA